LPADDTGVNVACSNLSHRDIVRLSGGIVATTVDLPHFQSVGAASSAFVHLTSPRCGIRSVVHGGDVVTGHTYGD
jgi:hypothetical protein